MGSLWMRYSGLRDDKCVHYTTAGFGNAPAFCVQCSPYGFSVFMYQIQYFLFWYVLTVCCTVVLLLVKLLCHASDFLNEAVNRPDVTLFKWTLSAYVNPNNMNDMKHERQ